MGGVAFILLSVLAGAFVKGNSGFGASMMWVASLSLVLPPHRVVPMVLLWEVGSSLQLLPEVWRKIEWRSLGWLFIGVHCDSGWGLRASDRAFQFHTDQHRADRVYW